MKKIIVYSVLLLLVISCSPSKKELFDTTDSYVDSLQTTYQSYGVLLEHEGGTLKITSDGQYQIKPIGRLINVKILKAVDDKVYEDLEEDLKNHYKNDKRVNDVYINGVGTIMIDCRN